MRLAMTMTPNDGKRFQIFDVLMKNSFREEWECIPKTLVGANGSRSRRRYSDAVAVEGASVTNFEIDEELPPPETGVRVVYLGPVSPHWDIQGLFGEQAVVDEFRRRTVARLQLLPPHDPQFRRNRERVNRDAERENLHLEWDLGVPEDEEE
ncbi:MAG: hypothetical protein P8J75_03185 [Actinomycetota bacterium]|nr:hypothetical protein [Actinomycetota bacterium]